MSSELSFFTLPNCFQLFGFDLLVDEDWHLWLLEVTPLQLWVFALPQASCTSFITPALGGTLICLKHS